MKEYVITHLHTMNSNSILADSPSKLEDYLKEIKNKDGIRGIIRTEHGPIVTGKQIGRAHV